MPNEANFSGFFSETLALLSEGVRGVVLYVLAVAGMNGVLLALGLADMETGIGALDDIANAANFGDWTQSLAQIVIGLLTLGASYFLLAHFMSLRGRVVSPDMRILPFIGMSILAFLGVVLGFLLFVIPALILLVRWSAANGFLVSGQSGVVDALSQSWNATRGYSWPIFGVAVVISLATLLVMGAFAGITFSMVDDGLWIAAIITTALDAFSDTIYLALSIAVYHCIVPPDTSVSEVFS